MRKMTGFSDLHDGVYVLRKAGQGSSLAAIQGNTGTLCISTKPREKFDLRVERCMFIGYPQGQKRWRVYNLKTREFIVRRDVIFYENVYPYVTKEILKTKQFASTSTMFLDSNLTYKEESVPHHVDSEEGDHSLESNVVPSESSSVEVEIASTVLNDVHSEGEPSPLRESTRPASRNRQPPSYLKDNYCHSATKIPSCTSLSFSDPPEVVLAEIWLFQQAFRWRPVTRSVMTEKLPIDYNLPGLDIFVCTIDPEKEPTVDVMDTVISAIAMDYPSDKLAVYLSDDGGCPVTLFGMREACEFSKVWLPFCKKYGIKARCPKVFFSPMGENEQLIRTEEFQTELGEIKAKYNNMRTNIEKFGSDPKNSSVVSDRAARIEIINDQKELPLVVYVSRERRPSVPHRYKGGALNTLLRVSGLISNGPYVLVVDCDMYCNDPSSAKQAMCFFLDPATSEDVAFVQFPQMFHNLSKKDIYDSQTRNAFTVKFQGMDGLRGPGLSGSGNYLSRSALLFGSPNQEGDYLLDAQNNFGQSTMYIESLKVIRGEQIAKKNIPKDVILQEAHNVASCSYEENTYWGRIFICYKVGEYMYWLSSPLQRMEIKIPLPKKTMFLRVCPH
ncbi:Nucleotide-diphospho-sugar transferase [Sesbania bispinosa]|nr:Nucleotide-diphospho-sugar transferase [Sesbania bispinosa]